MISPFKETRKPYQSIARYADNPAAVGGSGIAADGGLNRCLAVTKKFHEKQKRTSATEEVKTRRTSRK
jgi:hypothetical protein